MQKIVVTGALGHIGSRLIRTLPEVFPGSEILLIDNLLTQRYTSLFNLPAGAKFRFVEADILEADMERLFENADAVIHLAAITNAAASVDRPEEVENVNFRGTELVARACCRTGSSLLSLSTTSVYGVQEGVVDENCRDEDLAPQSPYAESKLKAEKLLAGLGDEEGLNFAVCRFGTIFGISRGMRFHTAVNKFVWQACTGQPITVWRTALHQKRPYLDLGDATRAIAFFLKKNLFDRQIYNVVTINATVNDIVEAIGKHVPRIEIKYVDSAIMNQLSYTVSGAKLAGKGFTVSGDLDTGIAESVAILNALNPEVSPQTDAGNRDKI